MISMVVNQSVSVCPPPVIRGSACESQIGQYIYDDKGCVRKICPALSNLCNVSRNKFLLKINNFYFVYHKKTIRCPFDRICRVVTCQSCTQTGFLQPICEYSSRIHF